VRWKILVEAICSAAEWRDAIIIIIIIIIFTNLAFQQSIISTYIWMFVFLPLRPTVVVFSQPGSGLLPPRFRGFLITRNDAPQLVGLLWTSDQSVAEISTWQHTTLTTDNHPCPRGDSNPQCQQASGRIPTP
jgi:hypothetical protein